MPFTLAQAEEIWDDFEDLKDTEFKQSGPAVYLILDIIIAPFGKEEQLKFIDKSKAKQGKEALNDYPGSEFDVLLVACDVEDETNLLYMDIRTFASEKGINYSFPPDF